MRPRNLARGLDPGKPLEGETPERGVAMDDGRREAPEPVSAGMEGVGAAESPK